MIEFCKEEFFKEYGPREKLKNQGISELKNYELWALAIGSGTKNRNILEISKEIVQTLDKLDSDETENLEYKLKKIKGIGNVTALKIKSIMEISNRINYIKNQKGSHKLNQLKQNKINSTQKVFEIMKIMNKSKQQETFNVMYLNSKLEIIKTEMIFKGTLNFVNVHPREIFKKAVLYSAHCMILGHNHPTGDLVPSLEDKNITNRLVKLGIEMGIKIIDHVIISDTNYRSMLESNDINFS